MFSLRALFGRRPSPADTSAPSRQIEEPPATVMVEGAAPFAIAEHLEDHEGYPLVVWDDARDWLSRIERPELQSSAWPAVQRAWLLHMRAALSPDVGLRESASVLLLSSLDNNIARALLDYTERTRRRVMSILDGVAQLPTVGKEVLLVFDDDESYYRYVSFYYSDAGEFALSGGMHIDAGCSHYATVKSDLRVIEPVIAHEMTHGCLRHLPLPAWLNEGLAVNVEHSLSPTPATHTPQQLRAKHLAFWGKDEIQEFWSGRSFLRADDGNLLSYDLARLMVDQLSASWEPFKRFVLAADGADGGAAAAHHHLDVGLGEVVAALLDRESPGVAWAPDPAKWQGAPERGRFAAVRHALASALPRQRPCYGRSPIDVGRPMAGASPLLMQRSTDNRSRSVP